MGFTHYVYLIVAILVLTVLADREQVIPEGERKDIRTLIMAIALSIVFMIFGVSNPSVIIGFRNFALGILFPGFLLSIIASDKTTLAIGDTTVMIGSMLGLAALLAYIPFTLA